MSDDLISRKALLKELREIMDEPHNTMFLMGIGAAVSIIEHREMAFDKEKVIEKIKDESSSERFEDVGISGNVYGHYSKEVIDTEEAIEIVEKGGIE